MATQTTPHQLSENELGRMSGRILDWLEKRAKHIAIGIGVVLLLTAIVVYWRRSRSAMEARAWEEMLSARTAEEFDRIAERNGSSSAAVWAQLASARIRLNTGVNQSTTNRKASTDDLRQAQETYEQILKSGTSIPEVREQALYGLAVCLETLSDGSVQPAIDAYQKLLTEFPATRYLSAAQRRITALQSPGASDFYRWFRQQNPKPEERPAPLDGLKDGASTKEGDAAQGTTDSDDKKSSAAEKTEGEKTKEGEEAKSPVKISDEELKEAAPESTGKEEGAAEKGDEALKEPVPVEKGAEANPAEGEKGPAESGEKK